MKQKLLSIVTMLILVSTHVAFTQDSSEIILLKATEIAKKENKHVFIMFHASWCGWCKKMDNNINNLACKDLFDKHGLANIFLITPQTSEQRIREIDALSTGFIYMVSSASTTGKVGDVSSVQEAYFERIKAMGLRSPLLIGFGIHDHASFTRACEHAQGAIIGSALIKALSQGQPVEEAVRGFVGAIHHLL